MREKRRLRRDKLGEKMNRGEKKIGQHPEMTVVAQEMMALALETEMARLKKHGVALVLQTGDQKPLQKKHHGDRPLKGDGESERRRNTRPGRNQKKLQKILVTDGREEVLHLTERWTGVLHLRTGSVMTDARH